MHAEAVNFASGVIGIHKSTYEPLATIGGKNLGVMLEWHVSGCKVRSWLGLESIAT